MNEPHEIEGAHELDGQMASESGRTQENDAYADEHGHPARRRQRLIKPGIQLRLAALFAGLTCMCLMIQWLLFSSILASAAQQMPVGGDDLLDLIPTLLGRSILFSFGLALPLTMFAGVYATFRLTGPIHRFETYLREVIRGTQLGPCRLRSGDALEELCELINDATEPLRRRGTASERGERSESHAA